MQPQRRSKRDRRNGSRVYLTGMPHGRKVYCRLSLLKPELCLTPATARWPAIKDSSCDLFSNVNDMRVLYTFLVSLHLAIDHVIRSYDKVSRWNIRKYILNYARKKMRFSISRNKSCYFVKWRIINWNIYREEYSRLMSFRILENSHIIEFLFFF